MAPGDHPARKLDAVNYQPHSLDAEETVLGAAFLSEKAIESCAELLDGHEFYRGSHGTVWKAILEMWRAGQPVDEITLAAHLDAHGTLADSGDKERLHELAALVPAAGNAAHHARIVRDLWAKRTLAAFFEKGREAALNGMPPDEIMERTEKRTLDLRALIERGKRRAAVTLGELADKVTAELAAPPTRSLGVAAPFRSLRRLQPGRVYLLAGYTAHGKTVLAVQYIRAACADGARVGVFSIEMTRDQLYDRMLAGFGIPLTQIENRVVGPVYTEALENALAQTRRWQAEINDDRGANAAMFHRWQRMRRYDLLVIDHLHEIDIPGRASDHRANLELELLRIATVARELEVPIVLLAQLSRGEGTGFPRPTVRMLRETGRIEQIAAQVAFVWRKVDEGGIPGEEAELIVAKDRFGPQGFKIPLRFDGEHVRFTEVLV